MPTLLQPKYLLRWRYDFANRPTKVGMWSQPGTLISEQAWANNGEGMVRAIIEGKNIETREIVVLHECAGQDFKVFQWVAAAGLGSALQHGKPVTKLLGLKIVSRHSEDTVFIDGSKSVDNLTTDNINFATYGK